MGFVSDYDTDADGIYTADTVVNLFYSDYDLFKQAAVGLWTASIAALADGGSSDDLKSIAQSVSGNPSGYAKRMMGAFMGDSAIQSDILTPPTDGQMLTAATWILPVTTLLGR